MRYSATNMLTARPLWGLGGLVGWLLVALALPASVQGQSLESLIEEGRAAGADVDRMRTVASRAEQSGLSSQQTAALLTPAVSLAERDLPTTPLLNKTLEGLAKRVPARRMTPVLQQIETHTQKAGTVVGTWTQKQDTKTLLGTSDRSLPRTDRNQLVANIAEAQQQNVPLDEIETFLNELPRTVTERSVSASDVAVAVSVMPDLPTATSAPGASRDLLTAALNSGYDSESLRQLPGALERAQHTNARPAASIAKSATQAIARGTSASTVLRTLFQGTVPNASPAPQHAAPSSPPGRSNPPGRDSRPTGVDPPPSQNPSPDGGAPPSGPPSPGGDPPGDSPSPNNPPGQSPEHPPSSQ
jgi:hypothetical protein